MSTRRLIITALLCALAILVAGGVFLFRTAANRDELTVRDVFTVGQTAKVGSTDVTVVSATVASPATIVIVDLTQAADGVTIEDVAKGFSLASGATVLPARSGDVGAVTPCVGVSLAATTSVRCAVRFETVPASSYFVSFRIGKDQVQWRLTPS